MTNIADWTSEQERCALQTAAQVVVAGALGGVVSRASTAGGGAVSLTFPDDQPAPDGYMALAGVRAEMALLSAGADCDDTAAAERRAAAWAGEGVVETVEHVDQIIERRAGQIASVARFLLTVGDLDAELIGVAMDAGAKR